MMKSTYCTEAVVCRNSWTLVPNGESDPGHKGVQVSTSYSGHARMSAHALNYMFRVPLRNYQTIDTPNTAGHW